MVSAVAVNEDGTVGPPELGDRERPTFLRVDAGKKELTLLAPESRRGEVTKLETVHEKDAMHILSGMENGRNLSPIITADGRMTLSVIADGVVWSVIGNALPEDDAKPASETKWRAWIRRAMVPWSSQDDGQSQPLGWSPLFRHASSPPIVSAKIG